MNRRRFAPSLEFMELRATPSAVVAAAADGSTADVAPAVDGASQDLGSDADVAAVATAGTAPLWTPPIPVVIFNPPAAPAPPPWTPPLPVVIFDSNG